MVSSKNLASVIIAVAVGSVLPSSHFAIADWLIPVANAKSIRLCHTDGTPEAAMFRVGAGSNNGVIGYSDEDKVMIVDYKTNRPPAKKIEDVPSAYVKQMKAYKMVVEKIYENRKVETYILWTNTATMMQIV